MPRSMVGLLAAAATAMSALVALAHGYLDWATIADASAAAGLAAYLALPPNKKKSLLHYASSQNVRFQIASSVNFACT